MKLSVCKGFSATMFAVNKALEDETFRTKTWQLLDFPADMRLPELSDEMLFGDVSTVDGRYSTCRNVYLSDELPVQWAIFFNEIVKTRRFTTATRVLQYSEETAALGRLLDST